jgi:uncharacterized protein YecT (DUF1311 family)
MSILAQRAMRFVMRKLSFAGIILVLISAPACADAKPDCENGSQSELNMCAYNDFEKADSALNKLWPKIKSFATDGDGVLEGTLKGYVKALLASQRAWISYRDGQCELYGFQSRGGSMEPMLVSGCKARMTNERIKELKDIMNAN